MPVACRQGRTGNVCLDDISTPLIAGEPDGLGIQNERGRQWLTWSPAGRGAARSETEEANGLDGGARFPEGG
jgi:hypothetical protein